MKNLLLIFILSSLLLSCRQVGNESEKKTNTVEISMDSSDKPMVGSKDKSLKMKKKDTVIIKNLDDCILFYKNKESEVSEFLNKFELLEIPVPYYQLVYMDKTTHNSFFLVYSYTIELEEGLINLILCDSTGKVLNRKYSHQIYEYIKVEKSEENLYRIYGENPQKTNGQSDNLKNTGLDSEYDFDFYVNTRKIDKLEIND